MCIKINSQKAYEMVNREFVCHMLKCFGFPLSLIQLLHECISTPTSSIMIHGRPEGFISVNRGLRQGDPLSSYLFCIAMEFFTLLMEKDVVDKHLKPINKFQPAIPHLLYADDITIFLAVTTENAIHMIHIFSTMEKTVGLRVNQTNHRFFQ